MPAAVLQDIWEIIVISSRFYLFADIVYTDMMVDTYFYFTNVLFEEITAACSFLWVVS